MIIFSLFFVLAFAANVSAGDKQPPNIAIVKPTGNYAEGSTIPFEISGADNADAIICYLDSDLGNAKPYMGATTINDFFGQIGLNVGPHAIDCEAQNPWGDQAITEGYIVKAVPTTTTTVPGEQEIPEFPTAALPAIIAVGGYLAIRRMKNKE